MISSISELFATQGKLAQVIDGFQRRSEQIELVEFIYESIERNQDVLCEAGTGTGKTMAYLVAGLLSSADKIIISTGTRHLQEQVYEKELPPVLEALSLSHKVMVLKGRSNYLCQHRLNRALAEPEMFTNAQSATLALVAKWSESTANGDINELTFLGEHTAIHGSITSTKSNCMAQNCPEFQDCFVFKNRKKAQAADVVITNHHLLLADMALRDTGFGEVLPLADLIIFDEAHQLPELASIYFSDTLSTIQWFDLLEETRLATNEEAGDSPELLKKLAQCEAIVRKLCATLPNNMNQSAWIELITAHPNLATLLQSDLLKISTVIIDYLEQIDVRGKLLDQACQKFSEYHQHLATYLDSENEQAIRWVAIKNKQMYLHQTPISVALDFQKYLACYNANYVFISATLAIDGNFDHFSNQLGLDACVKQSWQSPFPYQKQTYLYLPSGIPEPSSETFFAIFIERVKTLIHINQGQAFILFTSYESLYRASKILKADIDYPVYTQGDMPRAQLLKYFSKTPHSVLLGTYSFWEGVDVKGKQLSLVIIEKLPFAHLGDPVLQARLQYITQHDGSPFIDYQLPQAAIRLKQGVGRLMRDPADYGVCMICDSRLVTRSYGKKLLKALPPMPKTDDLDMIKEFFAEKT